MGRNRAANRESRKKFKDQHSRTRNETLIKATMEVQVSQSRHTRPARVSLRPLNAAQELYDHSIDHNIITFGTGPAGTGKTWYAAMKAAEEFKSGEIKSIVITRPTVEVGDSLGFLPGDEDEKNEPYFRPVRDALVQSLGTGALEYALKAGTIEARPLQYLRGATFNDTIVIADEMQNATPAQMKMFLTRIGENCKVIINGDLRQKDIAGRSGLEDAIERIHHRVGRVGLVEFTCDDIVRSGIVKEIVIAYDN